MNGTGTASIPDGAAVVAGSGRPRLRLRLLLLLVVALAGISLAAMTGLNGNLVYYKTPTELVRDTGLHGKRVRVGGLVMPGSVRRSPGTVSFTLTDGVTDLHVVNRGQPSGVFQAGQGALVDGFWGRDDVFRSDQVLVKHDNTYRAPNGNKYSPPDPLRTAQVTNR